MPNREPLMASYVIDIYVKLVGREGFEPSTIGLKVRCYTDGTTHVIFEPLDFMARLIALVPRPRVNLTRFHGVFAPNSKHRALIIPTQRGKGRKGKMPPETETGI